MRRARRVVLVGIELAVEPEIFGVGAKEALDIRFPGQHLEVLLFEGPEVLRTNLGVRLRPGQLKPLAKPGFAQAVAYLEHEALDCNVMTDSLS
jgi:hypothetical protein